MPYLVQKMANGLTAGEWNLATNPMSFGHGEDATVRIDDRKMSRQHFRISPQANGYLLQDLGSTNGTLVNGVRVTEATLKPNDQIQAGGSKVFFIDGLQTIVRNLKHEHHHAAVEKLTDQTALARIAMADKEWGVRRAAVDTLADPTLLAKIAAESKDPDIRGAAVARIKPPA